MLQPNRTKYRKDQKGRNYGLARSKLRVVLLPATSSAAAVYGSVSSRTSPFPASPLKCVWVTVRVIRNTGLLSFSPVA